MAAGLDRRIKPQWSGVILVCAKCSKRLDGGFGKRSKFSLGKALRRHLGPNWLRKRRVGIVDVKCLGVCPRGSVTLVDTRFPDKWLVVPAGADIGALAQALGLARDAKASR